MRTRSLLRYEAFERFMMTNQPFIRCDKNGLFWCFTAISSTLAE